MAIDTLLPKKIDKSEASYKSVTELNEALSIAEKEHIKNIALTGPFGSGKSSVLITLMEDFANEHKFLPISLATLQANEEQIASDEKQDTSAELTDAEKEKRIENLNRKIEYSILQQIIYREETRTVPNSRFRKIVHLSNRELIRYPLCCVLTLVCFLILFEPNFARVDSIYDFFSWGSIWNTIFDLAASAWLLFVLYVIARYVFKSYSNSKLNKLNLKEGEIEVIEDNSIFNKHLDEILYFFQVTDYNVVIIEDLDRFGTPSIFLKLRELNQLINESKIVGRHITFIYAIKDDIFKDEERTKFFDFITTVIPVINPSNSKDKLKSALEAKGCGNDGISDEDLSEMAFFIQDMRILTNIVNEYKQYCDKLCEASDFQLNKTKLLGMIVYKNYYPQDFALLHCRKGKIYKCISNKSNFIPLALKAIEESENALSKKEQIFKQDTNLSKTDLRRLFLFKLWHKLPNKPLSVHIENNDYSFEQIASNEILFSKLLKDSKITYKYRYGYNYNDTESKAVDFKQIDTDIDYSKRINLLEKGITYFHNEHRRIQQEKIKVKSLRLKDLIKMYKLGETDEYKSFGLTPMMNVFVRRGYLDEDYYDYISYFYEGMVSLADRDLLLSMKIEYERPYNYHIDKIENFVKELKDYMFESNAILNIDLLDYFASHNVQSEKFEHVMLRLECENAPLQFLAQYYNEGKQQRKVFGHFIEYTNSWNSIVSWTNPVERDNLIEAYLKFCPNLGQIQQKWLNDNYKFLVEHSEGITLDKSLMLVKGSRFVSLCNGSEDLLDCVIENDCYKINLENIYIITRRLHSEDNTISAENLNYTRIKETNNDSFIGYVEDNISSTIQCLKDKYQDESSESLLFLLNNADIDAEVKITYLTGQHNHIDDFAGIDNEEMYAVAVKSKILLPTWNNVSFYYEHKGGMSDELISFINNYATELSGEICSNDLSNKNDLYVSLFGSKMLNVDNYRKLLKSFTGHFPYIDKLKNVGQDRLMILAEYGRILFNADAFSSLLINISKNESLKLELVVYGISTGLNDHNVIAHLLTSVGGDYIEVCNQDRIAKLSDNALNRQLLEALKKSEYISSYQNDKKDIGKLIVYHKTKKN
ncbi:hypothetical protein [Bacteroides fragilis]|uniref:YobI family P-loop NTPase n=1 Tax=Bacteroides fragilis TaxID=817 RepID=UPI0018CB3F92|nr:hypothetical protein [Bacteroides fragilis]MBG9215143.1 hypothetical protein [Bacteroides fragilis]MBG9225948.1 hypothetical protein [Bacteroides fragilis]